MRSSRRVKVKCYVEVEVEVGIYFVETCIYSIVIVEVVS